MRKTRIGTRLTAVAACAADARCEAFEHGALTGRDFVAVAAIGPVQPAIRSEERPAVLTQLRQKWRELSVQAKQPNDSIERQIARRVLSALSADGTDDDEYKKIISEFRLGRGGV